jgi:CheY-like chemotaxis protein
VLLLILAYILLQTSKKRPKKELKETPLPVKESEATVTGEEENIVVEEEGVAVQVETKETAAATETVAEPVEEEKPAVAQPAKAGRKLRGPNSSITDITKENFKEFAGLRLLVAEDNLINQKVIAGLLKDSGINMKIANDGQECLDILAEDPNYQIILMDAHMPRVDGLEATRLIRQNPAYDHITVMALSGDTGADDIRKMREAGMEEQLEKPLKVDALYQAIYCYFDPNATVETSAEEAARLDDALGLEMLGGDIELYHEVLSEFQALYRDSDTKIETWLAQGDLQSAQAILLDVTGIAQSIGAAELTQTAEEFREALIGQQSDLYPKLLKRYRAQLHSILADMAEI